MTPHRLSVQLLFFLLLLLNPISSLDFLFNTFYSSRLLLYGTSTIESNTLTLTKNAILSMGRAFYPTKISTRHSNSSKLLSFSTSFIFSISPLTISLSGHGFVFLFYPSAGLEGGSAAQHLAFLNRTNDGIPNNHIFGIEFDVFENPEFNDIDNNHLGVDVNSLTSITAHGGGYWVDRKDGGGSVFKALKLNNGENYQVWIDYVDFMLNVSMAPAGVKRPKRDLISVWIDLSDVFLDEMYVGFCAATGILVESHRILSWGFSNDNLFVGDELVTTNLRSFVPPGSGVFSSKGVVAGIVVGIVALVLGGGGIFWVLVRKKRRRKREKEEMEEWELEYWPHRIMYQEIYDATKGFLEENLIGFGGNGKVYKGVMVGGGEVAVKRFSQEREERMREFLAEVSSLGRLKHRNLVALRGWCKRDKGSLMLVYEYMENGSLDKRVFECEESTVLSWEDRIRVLKDVAVGVLYLHEGWEFRVLHRDIKASNVLLDKHMNGRLGDFGLARMLGHGEAASSTRVVGTVGYMAPEVVRSGRATAKTDVFGFGVLVLEVVCGRRPIEVGKPPLVDWIWGLMDRGELLNALDQRLRAKGVFDNEEVERLLHLGLLCSYPDPPYRPTMRQVVKVLEGTSNAYESEGEGTEVSLHDKMKSTTMWSKYYRNSRHGGHPLFEQIRQSLSFSISLSGSDIIVEGR